MKIGIARYPYFRQVMKGGDHVLFDGIAAALRTKHTVDFIDYRRPGHSLLPVLPARLAKLWVWIIDMFLPFFFTRQLLGRIGEFDLIIGDSAVVTGAATTAANRKKLVSLINIDYREYLTAVGDYLPLRARIIMRWKSWMQERGLEAYPSVAVSRFVSDQAKHRGLLIDHIVENQIQGLPEQLEEFPKPDGLVYAGSGDYWGKGLDVLEALSARGMKISTYSPARIPGCTNHGAVARETLLQALPSYQAMVFPSRYESFGLVAIEAMAMGVPVIMRHTGIGVDLAKTLPECVVPADPTDEDWEKAIRLVLAERQRIVAKGKLFAAAYADESRFSEQWRQTISKLASVEAAPVCPVSRQCGH